MRYSNVYIQEFGYELPPNVVTSQEIENRLGAVYERLKLPQGRLELMSGIKERRFWNKSTLPSYGAALAGQKALDRSGFLPEEIDCLLFTSVCRDMMEPATAAFVHNKLQLKQSCQIFDISNACLGFLNGMVTLANMIELGQVRNGLIVAGETAEDLVDSTIHALINDKSLTRKSIKPSFASFTIGSGAVAVVLSGASSTKTSHRLIGGACRANTSHNNLCKGGQDSSTTLMATDSEELLKRGVETAQLVWNDFLAELGWQPSDITRYFCHQVGSAHAKLLMDTLEIDPLKNYETLSFLGNVGSVSAPITLALGVDNSELLPEDKAAVLGIGSGINCFMIGIEW